MIGLSQDWAMYPPAESLGSDLEAVSGGGMITQPSAFYCCMCSQMSEAIVRRGDYAKISTIGVEMIPTIVGVWKDISISALSPTSPA